MTLSKLVNRLIGSSEEFSLENRTYNAANLAAFFILIFFTLLDICFKNYSALLLISGIILPQCFFYYLSRYKKQYKVGVVGNGVMSYIALIINYLYDSGSNGSTLLISFLTFQLLIAITERKQHFIWIIFHCTLAVSLIFLEISHPGLIKTNYIGTKRAIDLSISYMITLSSIYFITTFLGRNYKQEKSKVTQQARTIETQKADVAMSEVKLRAFFNSSPTGHILLGKNTEVLDFNNAAMTFVKIVSGTTISIQNKGVDCVCASYKENFMAHFNTAISGSVAYDEFKENDGSPNARWWAFSFEPAKDASGNISGISFNTTDVTERKSQEEKIRVRNEALIKIAHIQSHEFRKPVATICGLMNIIKEEDYAEPKKYLLMMEEVVQELDKKIHLVVNQTEQLL